jgi:hypothetical protein
MSEVDDRTKDAKARSEMARSRTKWLELRVQEARQHQREAELELERLLRVSEEPSNENLTVEALRERIADYARAHETGEDDLYWWLFRQALAELARRAEGKT